MAGATIGSGSGFSVDVEGDMEKVMRDLNDLQKKWVPSSAVSALKKVSNPAGPLIKRTISLAARKTGFPAKAIANRLEPDTGKIKQGQSGPVRRIYRRKSDNPFVKRMWTRIYVHAKDIPWTSLGAKDKGRYKVGKGGKRGPGVASRTGPGFRAPKAFIAQGRAGKQSKGSKPRGRRMVFERTGGAGSKLKAHKANIAADIRRVANFVMKKYGRTEFVKEFHIQLNTRLRKRGLL